MLYCEIQARQIWLRAVLSHPEEPSLQAPPLRAKIDTGATSSVIPLETVTWFEQQGNPLIDIDYVDVTVGDGRTLTVSAYMCELRLTDARGATWYMRKSDYPQEGVGFLAMPRSDMLIGMDLLRLFKRFVLLPYQSQATLANSDEDLH